MPGIIRAVFLTTRSFPAHIIRDNTWRRTNLGYRAALLFVRFHHSFKATVSAEITSLFLFNISRWGPERQLIFASGTKTVNLCDVTVVVTRCENIVWQCLLNDLPVQESQTPNTKPLLFEGAAFVPTPNCIPSLAVLLVPPPNHWTGSCSDNTLTLYS